MAKDNIMSAGEIPILFCSNQQYCQHMAVAIASLLINNPRYNFRIYAVMSEEAGEERRRIQETVRQFANAVIEFRFYNRELIRDFRVNDHITLDTYVRLFLPDLLDIGIQRLLYLDCDLLVCSDIGELWNIEMGDHIVGAVQDPFSDNHVALGFGETEPYYNAGVLLIDVQKWREADLTSTLVSYIRENSSVLRYHDQDAINGVLRGRILPLPLKWNFTPRHADAESSVLGVTRNEFLAIRRKPGIVHFASGFKPWNAGSEPHYKSWYYRYRSVTPWRDQPSRSGHDGMTTRVRAAKERTKAILKWHFPLFASLLRRWTGLGDPVFQRKVLTRRSYSG